MEKKEISSSKRKGPTEAPETMNSVLIESLKNEVPYLQQKYNENMKSFGKEEGENQNPSRDLAQSPSEPSQQEASAPMKPVERPTRAGGVYVPPHKLRALQKELEEKEKFGVENQRMMWELLRKSINGIINKVNTTNIQHIIVELLNENVLRGKGLVCRAIIKAQMASPNFSHVYAALVAVINTKLPEIGFLIIKRVILQFRRAFHRNNKLVCMATTKMLGHLINQRVLSDFLGLQLLTLLLENPTEDSVEMACDFMIETGQVLSELSPGGVTAIFERFKGILHEGEIEKKVQYSIENLFAIRKTGFADHPGVIPDLDLVEEEDQITHEVEIDDEEIDGEEALNIFKFDPFYEKSEEEWKAIKLEILGEENVISLKTMNPNQIQEDLDELSEEDQNLTKDGQPKPATLSEQELITLRRTIYLTIMNSVDFEACAHKLLKVDIAGGGHENEVSSMLVECCMQERTYLRFFGLLSGRFCQISEVYAMHFSRIFVEKYSTMHRIETNKVRNLAKLFAHLLITDNLEWKILRCIELTQESTTSSSRIFLKILFQEVRNPLFPFKQLFWKWIAC